MKDTNNDTDPMSAFARSSEDKNEFFRILDTDIERFQAFLDDDDVSDDLKEEIVRSVWTIVIAFIDLGFGVFPLDQTCGQFSEMLEQRDLEAQDTLDWEQAGTTEKFNYVARDPRAAERQSP